MSPPRSVYMNPVDQSSQLPNSSPNELQQPPVEAVTNSDSDSAITDDNKQDSNRLQPIPPPSEPKQYRAIGLVRGKYMPSADQFTRGTLLAADDTLIDAVLLGRVMSLVKNHLDLNEPHLWVVYPRTRQQDGNLHLQIVGVWEPEKLHQNQPQPEPETVEASETNQQSPITDGYFSIRGEVMFQSRDEEKLIIKIKQIPRTETDKPKFFKLQLKGAIADKVVGHFLDIHVERQGNELIIQQINDIGRLQPKKPFGKKKFPPKGGKRPPSKNYSGSPRPPRQAPGDKAAPVTPPKRTQPIPKPVKRNQTGGNESK